MDSNRSSYCAANPSLLDMDTNPNKETPVDEHHANLIRATEHLEARINNFKFVGENVSGNIHTGFAVDTAGGAGSGEVL